MGFLACFVALLFVLPSTVIVGPLGAPGSPAGLVSFVGFLLWAMASIRGVDAARRWRPERIGLVALWIVSLASYFALQQRGAVPEAARSADRWLISLVAWSGIVLVSADLLRTLDEVRRVLRAFMLGASFSAGVALLQFSIGFNLAGLLATVPLLEENVPLESISSRGGFSRVAGTAIHPIEFGAVCALAVAIGIHLLIYDRAVSPVRRYVPLALVAIGIPLSISRSAALALVVVLAVLFLAATPRQRVRGSVAVALGVGAIHAVVPGLLDTLRSFLFADTSSSAVTSRTNDYAMVEGLVGRFPIVGQGGGTDIPHAQSQFLDNQYLLSAVELGVAGVVALLLYVMMPIVMGLAIKRRAPTAEGRHLGLTFAACGFAIVLLTGTFDALSFPMFAGTVALLVGLAGATWRIVREEQA